MSDDPYVFKPVDALPNRGWGNRDGVMRKVPYGWWALRLSQLAGQGWHLVEAQDGTPVSRTLVGPGLRNVLNQFGYHAEQTQRNGQQYVRVMPLDEAEGVTA